ncbi:MAG: c-type cytochrome [Rhodanobacter sp.]
MNKADHETGRQFAIMISLLIVTAAIIMLVASLVYHHEPEETDPNVPAATAARIAPVAGVYAGDTGRAAMQAASDAANKAAASQVAYGGTTDGKEIYDHLCTSCHTAGIAGAPKLGDKSMWAPRLAQGIDTLVKHAIDGYHGPDGNFMPPKGGNPALTDEQVTNAVHWIADQAK